MAKRGVYCDPETIELLGTALEEAWTSLSPDRQQTVQKAELAERLLAAAAAGEHDLERLRRRALKRTMDKPAVPRTDAAMVILRTALTRKE
jgi:hypothetical protein